MLGFEIELLLPVDIGGRPVPEKIDLGKYGDQNVGLTVDHSPDIEELATVPAGIAQARDVPWKEGTISLGAYDLRAGYEAQLVPWGAIQTQHANAVPGFERRPFKLLRQSGWPGALHELSFEGCPPGIEEIRQADEVYDTALKQKNVESMIVILDRVQRYATRWLATEPPQTWKRTERERRQNVVSELQREARYHLAFWGKPQFREVGADQWTDEHPVEHFLGREGYHSILELVTRPYAVEAQQGAADLTAAVTQAAELADRINSLVAGEKKRVKLEAADARVKNVDTWVGNPLAERQTVAASIQVTFAVDLRQMPSLFKSLVPSQPKPTAGVDLFALKHHADNGTRHARTVAGVSPNVASAVLKQLASAADYETYGGLVGLRGLLTIMCQYLLMGRYFADGAAQLDKNVVPLLSRTDLAHIYRGLVPEREKEWVGQHSDQLQIAILSETGREPASMLFTDPGQQRRVLDRAPLNVSCQTFVANVFAADRDGVTDHLDEGIFKKMAAEQVHPAGSQLAHESVLGPVFELRNMVPPVAGKHGDRFATDRWVPLAKFLIAVLTELHSRQDASVDVRYRRGAAQREDKRWWEM